MLFFKRIFDFRKEEVQQLEQRLNKRHVPGKAFPVSVRLHLIERVWPARIRNISAGGFAVEISGEAPDPAGLAVNTTISIEGFELALRVAVTHSHREGRDWICGLSLGQVEFNDRKAFLQLLQPIAIGTTMRPVPPERVQQHEPQFVKQVYTGESGAVLSVWLEKKFGTPLYSFEFSMSDYFVKGDARNRVLDVFLRETLEDSHKGKMTNPVFDTSGGRNDDIRQLFRWVVYNLPEDLPSDIREFLREIAK